VERSSTPRQQLNRLNNSNNLNTKIDCLIETEVSLFKLNIKRLNATLEVVIPSKRASRKRWASVSPERPSRSSHARRGGCQARRSLRGQPIFTEATEAT
jgi:hypothetical protein